MKRALITGITGQDGSYLTEFLLDTCFFMYFLNLRPKVHERIVCKGAAFLL